MHAKVPQVEYVDHHIEIPVAKHVPSWLHFQVFLKQL